MDSTNPQVECKLRTVMSPIRLGEQTEIAVLILGKLCVECLQKLPYERCSGDRRVRVIRAEAEASTNGLVYVEHVGVVIPTMRVRHGG
jgi:hypothetical protein